LSWAKGKVATIKGIVEVDWSVQADGFHITVKVPDDVSAVLVLPDGTEHIFTQEMSIVM